MEKRQIRGKGVFDAKQVGERPAIFMGKEKKYGKRADFFGNKQG